MSSKNVVCSDFNTSEDMPHILKTCSAYDEERSKKLEKMTFLSITRQPKLNCASVLGNKEMLCQFILDLTSLKLRERIKWYKCEPFFLQISRFTNQERKSENQNKMIKLDEA